MDNKKTITTHGEPEDIFSAVEGTPSTAPLTAQSGKPASTLPALAPITPVPDNTSAVTQPPIEQTGERPIFIPPQQSVSPLSSPPNIPDEPLPRQPQVRRRMGRGSKIRFLVAGGVLLIASIALFVIYYPKWFGTADSPVNTINQVTPLNNTNTTTNTNVAAGKTPRGVDSDGDGLLDDEEAKLGTNPNRIDSDTDGLTDRQEIHIYQTDPLNDDTDGDRYMDGEEVRHLYNPKGKGKLLDPVEDIKKQESTSSEGN